MSDEYAYEDYASYSQSGYISNPPSSSTLTIPPPPPLIPPPPPPPGAGANRSQAQDQDLEVLFDKVWSGYGAGSTNGLGQNGSGSQPTSPTTSISTLNGNDHSRDGYNPSPKPSLSGTGPENHQNRISFMSNTSGHSSAARRPLPLPPGAGGAATSPGSAGVGPPPGFGFGMNIPPPPPPPMTSAVPTTSSITQTGTGPDSYSSSPISSRGRQLPLAPGLGAVASPTSIYGAYFDTPGSGAGPASAINVHYAHLPTPNQIDSAGYASSDNPYDHHPAPSSRRRDVLEGEDGDGEEVVYWDDEDELHRNAQPQASGQNTIYARYDDDPSNDPYPYDETFDDAGSTFSYEEDPSRFINFSLLSHIAVQLKDKIPKSTHIKSGVPYPSSFLGRDIVSTVQTLIQRELVLGHGVGTADRRVALGVARSLQSQLFFFEVEWGGGVVRDGVEDVYMFLDDLDGGGGSSSTPDPSSGELTELPTGIITALTKCYSPDCVEGTRCYSPRCPRKGDSAILGPPLANGSTSPISALERGNSYGNNPSLSSSTSYKGLSTNHDVGVGSNLGAGASGSLINGNGTGTSGKDWVSLVPQEVLSNLPESEVQRQTIIHTLISREEQYLADLDMIEAVYIKPLRDARPSIVRARTSTGNVSAKANAILGRSNSNGINGISYAGINGRRSGGGAFPSSVSQDDHFSPNDRLSIEGEGLGENADVNATHTFISVVFGNILDVRETNRRLLEILYIRQREEGIVVRRVGDIFLHAATELFRVVYPIYLSGWWEAERVLREEMEYTSQHQLVGEGDVSFKSWVDQANRQAQQLQLAYTSALSSGGGTGAGTISSISSYDADTDASDGYSNPYTSTNASTPSPNTSITLANSKTHPATLHSLLTLPIQHLQKYGILLNGILEHTSEGNPDAEYLHEAVEALGGLRAVAQLRTFQTAMGVGVPGKWEWFDLVGKDLAGKDLRESLGIGKRESKRQSIIFELIKGEMAYVKDLENIDGMYIRPLLEADPPIIPRDRLESFIQDVFHNFAELHAHHRRLVERFHEIQREEHPVIRSVTAAVFDAALNFRDAYMEYIPNYPIAAYRIDDEMANNAAFKVFVEQCVRHSSAHRLDMKNFINRPIPRLLRYELLLKGILDETPEGHEDRVEIPQVLEVIKALGKDTEPGVVSAKQKVELWRYNSNIVFKPGEWIDMDLLDKNRSLIHTGRLLRQPEGGLDWSSGWSELFVLLFDNYLVMTKAREKDGITKYFVNRRPIPLDLLTLVNFTDPPTQRGAGLLRNLRGGERHNTGDTNTSSPLLNTPSTSSSTPSPMLTPGLSGLGPNSNTNTPSPADRTDPRSVYPFTLHHNGRMGGNYILYAESPISRQEWKDKLEEAVGLRKVVQESNKVFEIETLSMDTFLVPTMLPGGASGASGVGPAYENSFTGKVTCSVPFNTPDGRGLVAIGCAEGVWIGFRHDSRSMRRVLHLKMVTQCAMLEDFGIFLVLADKSLFAYHIEALVPSSPSSSHSAQTPQKLSGNKDVYFFSVGTLHGRTLVIYMKKKGLDSIFHVVEPVTERINERTKAPAGLMGSRFGFRQAKSDWFRAYREFFLPSESYDLIFLKVKIVILCAKGFEIMDLMDLQSVTIPQREDPRHAPLAKRWESCRPLGMFRSTDEEFLLCYTEFGLYVNKHGDPSRHTGSIEWEGTAERVALHPPYVLLFDTRFIEVRHVHTGRLAQIIPGNDVRCLWDGRGVHMPSAQTPGANDSEEHIVQEARVHAVMNADPATRNANGGVRPSRAVAQHVFELIPTIPLYLPGSLASPSTMTYFPPSFSPPHSPNLRPNTIYRS